MNTPLRDGKGTLYEGGTRVPLMWSWAGKIAQGRHLNDAIVGPVDVYPTLIDLLGIAKPEQQTFDGVSYAKVLKGEGDLAHRLLQLSSACRSESCRGRVGAQR
jgi:arylsulfatase A-like enzyme